MADLKWNGEQFEARVRAHMARNVAAACIALVNHAKELLSVDGTEKRTGGRDAKGRFLKSKLRYNANPSKPGEAPHLQTGRLRGSVAWEVVGLLGRVGTNLRYGRWLELGTRKMAARPWLRASLKAMLDRLRRILSRPMPLP